MLEQEIVATVPGDPAPKGSLKCIARPGQPHRLVEDNKRTKPWRGKLADAFGRVRRPPEAKQPIGVEVTLTIARPAVHFGTGRNADRLKAAAPAYPTGHNTGDVDKLARLVLDALQDAKVLPDDCQVVELTARKAYTLQQDQAGPIVPDSLPYPGALVRVYPVETSCPD